MMMETINAVTRVARALGQRPLDLSVSLEQLELLPHNVEWGALHSRVTHCIVKGSRANCRSCREEGNRRRLHVGYTPPKFASRPQHDHERTVVRIS